MFWPEFVSLFASLEPTLTVQQLQCLWQNFDGNGDSGVSPEEFRRGLATPGALPEATAPIPSTPSHGNVCSRIRAALLREGKTARDLFSSLSGGATVMRWQDFASLFAQLEPSLSLAQLERLWASFDINADGGVSLEEFERGLVATEMVEQPATGLSMRATSAEAEVCQRVLSALSREGMTTDQLFTALAKDSGFVLFPDFAAMFAKMEPSLQPEQLERLWKLFDKDGNGGVDRDEFLRGLTVSEEPRTDVCQRVLDALSREGMTPDQLFTALAKDTGFVMWPDFSQMFAKMEPSLPTQELEKLWKTFDEDGNGGVDRDEFVRGLARKPSKPSSDVCQRVLAALSREGMTVDQLFTALAKDTGFVMWPDFSQMFAKMEPSLPTQELENLWRTFDEDGNGGVDRNEFIRGLTIQTAKPVASDVCQRVLTALSREGMTADQLFTALAKDVGFVLFHDFSAMFAKLEPSLSTQQLQNLWQTFDADGNGGVDRDEFIRGLSQQDAAVTFPRDAAAYDTGAGVGLLAGTPA